MLDKRTRESWKEGVTEQRSPGWPDILIRIDPGAKHGVTVGGKPVSVNMEFTYLTFGWGFASRYLVNSLGSTSSGRVVLSLNVTSPDRQLIVGLAFPTPIGLVMVNKGSSRWGV